MKTRKTPLVIVKMKIVTILTFRRTMKMMMMTSMIRLNSIQLKLCTKTHLMPIKVSPKRQNTSCYTESQSSRKRNVYL